MAVFWCNPPRLCSPGVGQKLLPRDSTNFSSGVSTFLERLNNSLTMGASVSRSSCSNRANTVSSLRGRVSEAVKELQSSYSYSIVFINLEAMIIVRENSLYHKCKDCIGGMETVTHRKKVSHRYMNSWRIGRNVNQIRCGHIQFQGWKVGVLLPVVVSEGA